MKSLKELKAEDLRGKRVVLRLDLNVPVQDGMVTDNFRIVSAIKTLKHLTESAEKVTIIAHCEANREGETCTLRYASEELQKFVPHEFVNTIEEARSTESKVVLVENLRQYEGEKKNDERFAQELSRLGDIYVNEAFSVSHRKHASIVGVPKLISGFAGFQLEKEVENLSKAFAPEHPFVFILGGAKFETKLPLIEKFMDKADKVFIGGALANDLLKASGFDVKKSRVSPGAVNLEKILQSEKLIKVTDVVWDNEMIVDVGENSTKALVEEIKKAKFVLWNGPLGYFEGGYKASTNSVAEAIATSSLESVIGGGDTIAAIKELNIMDKFSFVSTGGGATLDFLAEGTLPGIQALA